MVVPSRLSAFAFLLLGCCNALAAQTGVSLVQGDPFACFTTMDGSPTRASYSTVAVDGPGFTQAWDLRTATAGTNSWDTRLRCFGTQPAAKGDVIVATFWMRTITPGQGLSQGTTTFVFERGASPYDKDGSYSASAGTAWQRFDVVSQASDNYTGTSAYLSYNLSFWVNYAGQEVQIGGFSILDYGQNVDPTTLNLSPSWPYEGHDPNAAWRQQALDRIERIRKADVALVVRDSAGKPLAGVPVHLRMKKHAFGWGTAVDSTTLSKNPTYAKAIKDNFNKIVLENDLKWPPFESWKINGQPSADYGLNWARDNGFTMVRGHNIIWPGKSNLPTDVQTMLATTPVDTVALSKRIDDHFQQVVTFARGRVTEWDVVNEPYGNHDVQDVLGDSVMTHWFNLAHQYDPNVKLYLNDYSIGEAGGVDQQHIDYTSNVVRELVASNAPLDAIGLQSHMDSNLTPPTRALHYFDYWANSFKPGMQIQVTEFDVNVPFETVQADYTRDYMIAAFSHPSMAGFMMWGFWEGAHWLPRGAMLRLDWSEKPNYKVWRDLVYKQWWTDVTGATTADGVFHTRAFLGDYDIEYTVNGATTTVPFTVTGGQLNYKNVGPAPAVPQFSASGVTNAASHAAGPVSPGELVTIAGTGIGLSAAEIGWLDDRGEFPSALALTRVLFDGTPAVLLAVSPGQAMAVVPSTVQNTTSIVVETLGVPSASVSVPVAAASPAFFTCPANADMPLMLPGAGLPLPPCEQKSPFATTGQAVSLYATGLSSGSNQVLFAGQPAPACAATGLAQPSPGIWRVDVCVPPTLATGQVEVRLQSGAIQSPPVHISVAALRPGNFTGQSPRAAGSLRDAVGR